MEQLETIQPLILAPWEERVEAIADEPAAREADAGWAIRIAVSSSARNDVVGVGGAIPISASVRGGSELVTYSFTLFTEQGDSFADCSLCSEPSFLFHWLHILNE